jgi:dihydropyrimidinase
VVTLEKSMKTAHAVGLGRWLHTGLILPVLREGYHKRALPLHKPRAGRRSNAGRFSTSPGKGEIKVGYDADLASVDRDWERTGDRELFGYSDFSIYAGMTFRGWPRYTLSRGEIIQKDGVVTARPGRGRYIPRNLPRP